MKLSEHLGKDTPPMGTGDGKKHRLVLFPTTDIQERDGAMSKWKKKYYVARCGVVNGKEVEEKNVSISVSLMITLRPLLEKMGPDGVVVDVQFFRDRPVEKQYVVKVVR